MNYIKLQKGLPVLIVLLLAIGLASFGTVLAAGGTDQTAKVSAEEQGGRPLFAALSGSQEVPGPGDSDGKGNAILTLNQGQGTICWAIDAWDIAEPTAAHIHEGAAGVSGPVVVTLSPWDGGCTSVDAGLIESIRQSPQMYYVNVHNADYPAGAIRGQLYKNQLEPYPFPPYP